MVFVDWNQSRPPCLYRSFATWPKETSSGLHAISFASIRGSGPLGCCRNPQRFGLEKARLYGRYRESRLLERGVERWFGKLPRQRWIMPPTPCLGCESVQLS